jgi:prepilin-type N-terminal cleavage/methylation domain-containing protein
MKAQGFTLIELAVVLAIIAVLAAVLTPVVTGYLDQARVTRALGDAKTIANAVNAYRRDTGFYPLYGTLANARSGTTNASALTGPGNAPAVGVNATGWTGTMLASTVGLVSQLNTLLSGMVQNDPNPGKVSYRGPYIGALDTDPWGNQYIVTGNNLAGTTNRAFVLSAGPNGTIETNTALGTATFAATGDDIAVPIN